MAAEPGNDAIWLTADLAASLGIKVVTVDAQAKAAQAKAASNDPISVALAAAEPEPAKDRGDAAPPPVKSEDIVPPVKAEAEPGRREQPKRTELPHHRRYAGGYGGRVCGFSVPVPYIGGITIRGRC
jgi:hypothetical protein